MSEYVVPVHSKGIFIVSIDGTITQVISFDYYDPDQYYAELEEREKLEYELSVVAENMQSFLNDEIVKINGERVWPRVKMVDLIYLGSKTRPSIIFFILFNGKFHKGINVYENSYESVIVEYDYEVYWKFPEGVKIVEWTLDGCVSILGDENILVTKVSKGEKISGHEKIVFMIPETIRLEL